MNPEQVEIWQSLIPSLPEAQRRWYLAQKALELGRGGIERVHEITGISRTTIIKGVAELKKGKPLQDPEGGRQPGGGRKTLEDKDPKVLFKLRDIMEENTAGDPMSDLKWTQKTTRSLALELQKSGFQIEADTIRRLLHEDGYSLQANVKDKEGSKSQDRDAQFIYINAQASSFREKAQPVISVDTKKRELVGDFKNPGRNWRKKGDPRKVGAYDFKNLGLGVAHPYGAYDPYRNEGFVNVGKSRDTAEFAVESIRQWWKHVGQKHYPMSTQLLICADGGGSNSSRSRLWKLCLQEFASKTGLSVTVCHYPPGTSKWNKIEHRMFSFISMAWKGKPLVSYETIVSLIGHTTTSKGLKIKARIDERVYEKGIKVPDAELVDISLARHSKHPKWNYTITPQKIGRKH